MSSAVIKKVKSALPEETVRVMIPFLGVFIMALFFQIVSNGKMLSSSNLTALFNSSYVYIIAAAGASFVYAQGNIDFSSGGIISICSILTIKVALATGSLPLMLIVCLVAGIGISSLMAILAFKFKVDSFRFSICFRFVLRGITWIICANQMYNIPLSMRGMDTPSVRIAVTLVLVLLVFILFERTKVGKYSKTIGSSAEASRQSGAPVLKMRITAYAISGLFTAMAAFMLLLKTGSSNVLTGQGFEFYVFLSIILGGMPLRGGSTAKAYCGLLGAVTMAVITNGMTIIGVNSTIQYMVYGLLLMFCVALSFDRKSSAIIP